VMSNLQQVLAGTAIVCGFLGGSAHIVLLQLICVILGMAVIAKMALGGAR
jgi:hypothetical protein